MHVFEPHELVASFGGYVRGDGLGGLHDSRDDVLRQLVTIGPAAIIEHMTDAPHDLAALATCCVRVNDTTPRDLAFAAAFARAGHGREMHQRLTAAATLGALPLIAEAGHPFGHVLHAFLETREGRQLYRFIVQALVWAREHGRTTNPPIAPYLFGYPFGGREEAAEDAEQGGARPSSGVILFDDVDEPTENAAGGEPAGEEME
ncbi:MAG: hypothetical protein Q7T01_04255 [bacterium]|nr:hypothetical protein [bacterium]